MSSELEELIAAVQSSAKYREISPELVRSVAERELRARRSMKEAVKATKNKLHQVGGAFLEIKQDYQGWLKTLQQANHDPAQVKRACREVMEHHASTRERINLLDSFYTQILADLPPIQSILDLGCGLNPLTAPWMPLAADAQYTAYDIYADMMDFLSQALPLIGITGQAHVRDLVSQPPTEQVDLAIVFKLLPTLEQVDKQAGLRLLQNLNARTICVSFPSRSLGGRNKGMAEQYAQRFEQLVADQGWQAQQYQFPNELVYRVQK